MIVLPGTFTFGMVSYFVSVFTDQGVLTHPRSDQNLSDQVFLLVVFFPHLFSLKIMKYTAWAKKLENIVLAKS